MDSLRAGEVKGAVWLPLDKILRDPHQPRIDFKKDAIDELRNSISDLGQEQAITVCHAKDKPGFYYIDFGESRWRACKLGGEKEILCVVNNKHTYDGKLDPSRVLKQTVENVCRSGHTHTELTRVMSLILEEEKEKQSKGHVDRAEIRFAKALGKSVPWAINYRTLTNLDPDLLKIIDTKGGGLTFMMGVELARNDQSVQKIIFEEAKKRNKSGTLSMLHKLIGSISRRHRIASGKRVRTRGSEHRETYFSFFKKLIAAIEHVTGSMDEQEFVKFEKVCLEYGLGERAHIVLSQTEQVIDFLQKRAVVLKKTIAKNKR